VLRSCKDFVSLTKDLRQEGGNIGRRTLRIGGNNVWEGKGRSIHRPEWSNDGNNKYQKREGCNSVTSALRNRADVLKESKRESRRIPFLERTEGELIIWKGRGKERGRTARGGSKRYLDCKKFSSKEKGGKES